MKQKELALIVNFSPEYINRLIKGTKRLTPENARFFIEQAFTGKEIRWEWLAGFDDYKTISEYKFAELNAEISRLNYKSFEMSRRTDRIERILDIMSYHIEDPLGGEEICRTKHETEFLYDFLDTLQTENNIIQRYIGNYRWAQFLNLIEEAEEENEEQLEMEGTEEPYQTMDDYRKECLRNPEEYIESFTKIVQQEDEEKRRQEYAIFDKDWNIIGRFTASERDIFVNELYDVINALIQYHITKKKGQP